MPQVEVAKMLMAGEKATIVGPGVVKFEALAHLGGAKAMGAGVGTAMAGGHAVGAGTGNMMVASAASGGAMPASLLSGKVLGFSLGGLNPWVLLAMGVLGGYIIAKKRYPKLVW